MKHISVKQYDLFKVMIINSVKYDTKPKVSILITTFERTKTLFSCLKSVSNQSFKDWELVLVSEPIIRDEVRKRISLWASKVSNTVKFIEGNVYLGRGKSSNIGLQFCEAPLILLPDDDMILDENCLDILVKTFNVLRAERRKVFAVGPRLLCPMQKIYPIRTTPKNGIDMLTGWPITDFAAITPKVTETSLLPFAALMDGDLLKKLRFDENYSGFGCRDDDDLWLRVRRLGYRLFYQSDAKVLHLYPQPGGTKKGSIIGRYRSLLHNHLYFVLKFFKWRALYMFLLFVPYAFLRWIVFPSVRVPGSLKPYKEVAKEKVTQILHH